MSNNKNNTMMFWKKSFPLCSFSISKCLPTIAAQSPPPNRLLTSFSEEEEEEEENDNLYYQTTNTSSSYSSSFTTTNNPNSLYATNDSSADDDEPEPDLSTVFASERFFFSSPGKSNSIVDQHTTEKELQKRHAAVEVRKYSADPRVDFRRSMKEMIEARHQNNDREIDDDDDDYDDRSDLEYLHELLLCFLALNPKDTHKYVISAFTDIVVDLLSSSSTRTENHARRRREVKLRRKRSGLRRTSM